MEEYAVTNSTVFNANVPRVMAGQHAGKVSNKESYQSKSRLDTLVCEWAGAVMTYDL